LKDKDNEENRNSLSAQILNLFSRCWDIFFSPRDFFSSSSRSLYLSQALILHSNFNVVKVDKCWKKSIFGSLDDSSTVIERERAYDGDISPIICYTRMIFVGQRNKFSQPSPYQYHHSYGRFVCFCGFIKDPHEHCCLKVGLNELFSPSTCSTLLNWDFFSQICHSTSDKFSIKFFQFPTRADSVIYIHTYCFSLEYYIFHA
jgi:hypothetical protein